MSTITRPTPMQLSNDAATACENGMWFNSRINPGQSYGPFSGDSMTRQVAFGAARNAVATHSGRPALEVAYTTFKSFPAHKAAPRKRELLPCYCDSVYHKGGC